MQRAQSQHGSGSTSVVECMCDKVIALRVATLVVGMQLMIQAMLLLRRWNY
jgi:hypothetical protein